MYFPESSMIITKDGLQCQVYSNEHPEGKIIVKPKYIPTEKISSDSLPYRFILGRKVNRLDLWTDKDALKRYIENFSKVYSHYIFKSDVHDNSPLFFAIPKEDIERVYLPRQGLAELMSMSYKDLDEHLRSVVEMISFLLKSGLELRDLGITYSTLMGYYSANMSDINIVVYGKDKFWKLMEFLENNSHKDIRWKSYGEWENFYNKRNRNIVHGKEIYLRNMYRKKSEGFFKETLFVIFAVENENETWFKWGEEEYKERGMAKFEAVIKENRDSIVRPGCYEISNSKFIEGDEHCKYLDIKKIVFHSRDYCMLAYPKEKVEVSGLVEEVKTKNGDKYYRIVIGYFDSHLNERRDKEYIRIIGTESNVNCETNKLFNGSISKECGLCSEGFLETDSNTNYKVIYKIGGANDGWFATLSPRTGGDEKKDFTIQLMPLAHIKHISEINNNLELAKNYGVAFAKITSAINKIMKEENRDEENEEKIVRIGTYGKSKHPNEHLHIKIFPWTGDIGQPYTVDSTFEKSEIQIDERGNEFVKMHPIRKKEIVKERYSYLIKRFIELLK